MEQDIKKHEKKTEEELQSLSKRLAEPDIDAVVKKGKKGKKI